MPGLPRVVAVDWSGRRRPQGHIWLADTGPPLTLTSIATREQAVARIVDIRADVTGLDFAFSFPAWFLDHLGVASGPELWARVRADGEEWLRRCDPPFWGRPGRRRPPGVTAWRRTEAGLGAKSVFQVGGAGAVGTASLRGMPYLLDLQAAGFYVWPFDSPRLPLVVEIYPRLFTGPVVKSREEQRAARLAGYGLRSPIRRAAEASEDAFDALVAALEMLGSWTPPRARHDAITVREGEVWIPGTPASRADGAETSPGRP